MKVTITYPNPQGSKEELGSACLFFLSSCLKKKNIYIYILTQRGRRKRLSLFSPPACCCEGGVSRLLLRPAEMTSKASDLRLKKKKRVPPACCSEGGVSRLLLRPADMTGEVVSAYYYISVLILLYNYMCVLIRVSSHFVSSCYFVSSYCQMCPHTTMFPQTTMCPHNTICVSSYLYVCVPAEMTRKVVKCTW